MKNISKGAVLAALAGGLILATGGVASADSDATGYAIGSPGLLSGNAVQIPINIPINACGNSINLVGFLNPTAGNTCANVSFDGDARHDDDGKGHREMSSDSHRGGSNEMAGQQYTQSAGGR